MLKWVKSIISTSRVEGERGREGERGSERATESDNVAGLGRGQKKIKETETHGSF